MIFFTIFPLTFSHTSLPLPTFSKLASPPSPILTLPSVGGSDADSSFSRPPQNIGVINKRVQTYSDCQSRLGNL